MCFRSYHILTSSLIILAIKYHLWSTSRNRGYYCQQWLTSDDTAHVPVLPSILSSLRGKNMVSSPSLEHFLYSLDTLFASVTVPKRRTLNIERKMTLLFSIIVTIEYWKCNFPMTRSVRRSVGCFVVRSVIISSKVGMLHFHAPIGALVFCLFVFLFIVMVMQSRLI